MRIICLVKIVPDTETDAYDLEKHVLIRGSRNQLINPDDETALAVALMLKFSRGEDTTVETVTLAPRTALPHLEDLLRRGVDRAVLITDPGFAGSDTYVTSRILARCLSGIPFDLVMTGTRTLDGGTSQVPAQIAEALGIRHMGSIVRLAAASLSEGCAIVEVDGEAAACTFEVDLPAVLGFAYSLRPRLPDIPYADFNREKGMNIRIVTNRDLHFAPEEIGRAGSLTDVVRVKFQAHERTTRLQVRADGKGIDQVYRFLDRKGFIRS